jgi:hypothetical protein
MSLRSKRCQLVHTVRTDPNRPNVVLVILLIRTRLLGSYIWCGLLIDRVRPFMHEPWANKYVKMNLSIPYLNLVFFSIFNLLESSISFYRMFGSLIFGTHKVHN